MVSIFITAFVLVLAILLLSGIGLYFWQRSGRDNSERILPPNPDFYGLFAEQPGKTEMKTAEEIERARLFAVSLLDRARADDKSALVEAKQSGEVDLYDQVLNELVRQLDSDAALVSLLSFVVKNKLLVNVSLANAAVTAWQNAPSRQGTAKALHFAALSDDADLYGHTIERALELWRAGRLANVSADELRALFDGEFWILSARTRSSGAGFVLKRTLANARRELESRSQNPGVSAGNLVNQPTPSDHPIQNDRVGIPNGHSSENN
jgi:hypothetical protein